MVYVSFTSFRTTGLALKWLAVNSLSTYVQVNTKACVWLMNEPWWTPVSETEMKRSSLTVKQFCSSDNDGSLRSLIRKMCSSPDDIQWRLERRCSGCVYQGHCTSEAAGTIRALPDQSTEAQSISENTLSEDRPCGSGFVVIRNVLALIAEI